MDESQFGACCKKRFVAAGNHDLTQRSVGQVFCLVDDENVRRFPLASVREQVARGKTKRRSVQADGIVPPTRAARDREGSGLGMPYAPSPRR